MSLLVQCGLTHFLVTLPTQMNNIAKQLTVVLNKNSPGRYRTHTDDPVKQIFYFKKYCNDELYNAFISNRIKTEKFSNSIHFKINLVQGKDETFDAEKTLKQDDVHDRFFENLAQIHNQSLMEEKENEDIKKLLSTLTEGLRSQLDPDFFQDDNDVQKLKTTTKYSNTKVKTRNLLTNVSYTSCKPEDVEKTNFVINVFSFLTQN